MIYDEFARQSVRSYELFLMALRGQYFSVVAPGVEVTPHALKWFILDAHILGANFLQLVTKEADSYLIELYGDTKMLPKYAADAKAELLKGVKLAVHENVEQVDKLLKVGTHEYARSLGKISGAMGELLQKKLGTIEFKVYDSANRKWDAVRIVQITLRDFAYQVWIEKSLTAFASDDYTLAQVKYADSMKASREIVFSIGKGVTGYPSFNEIKSKMFHPNATAQVIPYVQP